MRSFDLPFPLLLALRYLKSTRRDAFATFLSLVAATSIALGVAALVLALALLAGFQQALKDEVLSRTPEIEIELPADADPAAARQRLTGVDGVRAVDVMVRGRGWLVVGGGAEAVELVGFDDELPAIFPGARGTGEGLWVSEALAVRWGLEPGRRLEIVSSRPTLTPIGPQPRTRSLPLAGTFASSYAEAGERAALPRSIAETLLGSAQRRLVVSAGGLDAARELAPALAAVLPAGSRVATWADLNRPLLFALKLEKAMTFVAVSLVVVVASLALVADLALIIASKRAEIGMLGAMGASGRALRRAFVLLGALLAAAGVTFGGALGVSAALVLDRYRLLGVPGRVYFVDYVPFQVEPADLAAIVVLTVVLALAASFYAARRATAERPVEALAR